MIMYLLIRVSLQDELAWYGFDPSENRILLLGWYVLGRVVNIYNMDS
jgi:hypothetical protein